MHGKMQESGPTEIIPFISISAKGTVSWFFTSLAPLGLRVGNGCNLMSARLQVFSFLSAPRAHWLTLKRCDS